MRLALVALLVASSVCVARPRTRMQTPFEQARGAFRDEAAARLQKSAAKLHVTPTAEDVGGVAELRTGALYAFEAEYPLTPPPKVPGRVGSLRGFAGPTGEVVLAQKHNLGVLLREGRLLDEKNALTARALAERIVWLQLVELGQPPTPAGRDPQPANQRLVENLGAPVSPPHVERHPDGSASLVFYYATTESSGIGRASSNRAELRCSPTYEVTILRTKIELEGGL